VLISVGGANGSVAIADAASQRNFVESMTAIIQQYGFDGIDINLEGKVILEEGDTDFKHPVSPSIIHLIAAARKIKNNFSPDFIVSLAPETISVQGGYRQYRGAWGSYLPVIDGLRDILTYIQVQHYNSGTMMALDGKEYAQGTADFHVAMCEMLLRGFPINDKTQAFFFPLRPDQVAIGLPSSANIGNAGYTAPKEVQKALNYLSKGQDFGGPYHLHHTSGYPRFRGVMTWSINWDATTSFQFSTTTRNYLDVLP
jgi:chitinase